MFRNVRRMLRTSVHRKGIFYLIASVNTHLYVPYSLSSFLYGTVQVCLACQRVTHSMTTNNISSATGELVMLVSFFF